MKIIIYGSKYGTTKQYADELSKQTNIELINYKDIKNINDYETIIYIGALYAGGVLGMSKTLKKITNIENKKIIIITVGLSDPVDSLNINNIKNNIKRQLNNNVYEKASIYHLRGGIDYSKLNFIHKTMMYLLYRKAKKIPKEKQNSETKAMINTYNQKVNFVDFNNLNTIIKEIQNN